MQVFLEYYLSFKDTSLSKDMAFGVHVARLDIMRSQRDSLAKLYRWAISLRELL